MARVLIAFDKFKDCLTAREACDVAARALRARHPEWQLDLCPLADGGDGFAEMLTRSAGGSLQKFPVSGPRGGLREAPIGLVPASKIPKEARALLGGGEILADSATIAVIEMASASGLALVPPEARDPWQATSYGTGQLIRIGAELGAAAILLGIGGSATHDLGLGALAALGFEFRTADEGKLRPPVPAQWPRLARIDGTLFPSIPPIRIACDVSNPLLGPRGAAAVYAPQKGLRPADFDRLESETARVAELLLGACGASRDLVNIPGAGAAGGISFGLMAAAKGRLLPGFELVSAWLGLPARLDAADLVITGEGRYDRSSTEGKGPGAVAARARARGIPVHIFAGQIDGELGEYLHPITAPGAPLAQALRDGPGNLATAILKAF